MYNKDRQVRILKDRKMTEIRIGYACLNEDTQLNYRTLRKDKMSQENLKEIIGHNLLVLKEMLLWNEKNQVKVYRISSDLIPFGSSPLNGLAWEEVFQEEFKELRELIKRSGQRISFHPGQYTVLNSPKKEVVEASIKDLAYHERLLRALGANSTNKMVLHVGGVYGDKKKALERFIENYEKLDQDIKDHLVIENDHRSYNMEDVLYLSEKLKLPLIFDNLHHEINPPDQAGPWKDYFLRAKKTWQKKDGRPIIHYSQQKKDDRPGSHSDHIEIDSFKDFFGDLGENIDFMLEVKDKNRSFLSCNQLINPQSQVLRDQWSKYKYLVLLKSHKNYLAIRELLKTSSPNPLVFYNLIEEAAKKEWDWGQASNGYAHIWGYFKKMASPGEKDQYEKHLKDLAKGDLKKPWAFLKRMQKKYPNDYLSQSYLFRPGNYWFKG
mgnify:FL=1